MISLRLWLLPILLLFAIVSAPSCAQEKSSTNERSAVVARTSIAAEVRNIHFDDLHARILVEEMALEDENGRPTKIHVLDTNLRTLWTLDRGRIGGKSITFASFASDGALYIGAMIREGEGNEIRHRGLDFYRFGSNGEFEWHRTLDSLGRDITCDDVVDSRGNLLLLCDRDYNADTTERVVMKISTGGDLLWKRIIEMNGPSDSPRFYADRSDRLHIVNMRGQDGPVQWIEHRMLGADGTIGPPRTYDVPMNAPPVISASCGDDAGNVFATVKIGEVELDRTVLVTFRPDGSAPSTFDLEPPSPDWQAIVPDGKGNLWMLEWDVDHHNTLNVRSLRKFGESALPTIGTIEQENAKALYELEVLTSISISALRTGAVQIAALRIRDLVVVRFDSAGVTTLAGVTNVLRSTEKNKKFSRLYSTSTGAVFLVFDVRAAKTSDETIATEIVKFQP